MNIIEGILSLFRWIFGWIVQIYRREVGHLTIDRKSGKIQRERRPLLQEIRTRLLFNRFTEWIDVTKSWRKHLHYESVEKGEELTKPNSRKRIEPFVRFYGINMNDFEPKDIKQYQSFNDFFIRRLRPGVRPIAAENDDSVAIISADSRVVVFDTVEESKKLWIKGHGFTIGNLIQDEAAAKTWSNGAVTSLRLSPQDYHHYHSPVSGKVLWWREIDGRYYGVYPPAVNSDVDILAENARSAVCIESVDFGKVLFVAIGAFEVGTVKLTPGVKGCEELKKGDEIGWFEFGGSSVIVVFEEGRIRFDEDLRQVSKRGIEMDVQLGQSLGRAVKRDAKSSD